MHESPQTDRQRWDAKYAGKGLPERLSPPTWLTGHREILPVGNGLDLATGLGHAAIWLAREGWQVEGVDVSPVGLELARKFAEREGVTARTTWREVDLIGDRLGSSAYDVIVCTRFLLRDDFPSRIVAALRPGGVLVYETFTLEQLQQPGNHFKDDRFLLRPGELRALFADLKVLDYREGVFGGEGLASLIAQRE